MDKGATNMYPKIGEIYLMRFSGRSNEQSGVRPGLVFQNNLGNRYSPNIIALPISSSVKKLDMPTHVLLQAEDTGLREDSFVMCENPQRMNKNNIIRYITTLSDDDMRRVAEASLLATSAISFLDIESLTRIWHKAKELNGHPGKK